VGRAAHPWLETRNGVSGMRSSAGHHVRDSLR
jgi:hypothetical protein